MICLFAIQAPMHTQISHEKKNKPMDSSLPSKTIKKILKSKVWAKIPKNPIQEIVKYFVIFSKFDAMLIIKKIPSFYLQF